jgi:hypothetical protein
MAMEMETEMDLVDEARRWRSPTEAWAGEGKPVWVLRMMTRNWLAWIQWQAARVNGRGRRDSGVRCAVDAVELLEGSIEPGDEWTRSGGIVAVNIDLLHRMKA